MTIKYLTSALLLALVVVLIGWAGLRPFNFACPNGVRWNDPGPGLRFDKTGLAYSAEDFQWNTRSNPAALSLEIWWRADRAKNTNPHAWFALIDNSRMSPLGIRQEGSDLVIWDAVTNPGGDRWFNDFRAENAIQPGKLQHLAVTCEDGAPRLYVDGHPVEPTTGYRIPLARQGEPFGGTLVIGSGPPWEIPWSGEIQGLALYDQVLDEDVIQQHAQLVPGQDLAELAVAPGIVALYTLDNRAGDRVHDQSGHAAALIVPKYYRPPRLRFLTPVDLSDWAADWYALDVLVNLAGFIPFGFLLAMLLPHRLSSIWRLASVAMLAFVISLAIELTQGFMISRNSSQQDLILNTLGALIGAAAACALSSMRVTRFSLT